MWVDGTAIGLVALLLRGLYVASIWDQPAFHVLQVNAARYDAWARLILAGSAPGPPFEQGPAYPYFLSFVYALFGPGAHAVAVVQCLIGAATAVLVYAIGVRVHGRWGGLTAGLLAAAYAPFVYFTAEVLPATVFVFAIAAALAAVTLPSTPAWGWAGTAWAFAYLLRSNAILALPLVLVHAWRCGRGAAATRLAVPFVVVALALCAGNVVGGGELVWSTTGGGVNLWLGNNPHADGVNPFFGPDQASVDAEVRAQADTAAAADRAYTARSVRFWRDAPGEALVLAWKKLLWTFSAVELSNNVAIDWKQAHSWLFAMPGMPIGQGLLLVLAAAGLALHRRRGNGLEWTLLAPLLMAVGTCVLFFTNARFRLPMALSLLVLAGGVAAALREEIQRSAVRTRRIASASLAATAGVLLAYGNWYGVRDYRVPQLDVNVGAIEREARNFESAILFLRSGLGREPRDPIGWVHLALALEQAGQVDAAREAYAQGLVHVPGDPQIEGMQERFRKRNPR